MSLDDLALLRKSFDVARRALENGTHPFGAILVGPDGEVLLEQGNAYMPDHDMTGHAERVLMTRASTRYTPEFLSRCTMYTSAEPCAMCAGAIMHSRIARVIYGARDPKTGVHASVLDLFAVDQLNHHTEIVGGVLADECGQLLSRFFAERRKAAKA